MGVYRHRWRNGRVSWYARWKSGGVDHREAAGPTRAHALALLSRRIRERQESRHGVHVGPTGPGPTVAVVVAAYIAHARARGKRSVERMDRLAAHVTAAKLGARPAGGVREADLDAYIAHRLSDVGPATCNREVALVRAAMREAERRREIPRGCLPHFAMLREPPGRCRVLSPEEEDRALTKCPPWLRPIVLLAINTGCRQGEILGLRWSSVDLAGRWLHLEETKSGARRDVPLNGAAVAVLRAQMGGHGPLVFPTRRGTRITRSNLDRAWRAACRAAKVPDCRWHDLRHTTGGRVATETGSLLAVATLLGHGTPGHPHLAMAARYGHLSDSRTREAVEAIDRGRRGGKEVPQEGIDGEGI